MLEFSPYMVMFFWPCRNDRR